jgi:hypothetical protein
LLDREEPLFLLPGPNPRLWPVIVPQYFEQNALPFRFKNPCVFSFALRLPLVIQVTQHQAGTSAPNDQVFERILTHFRLNFPMRVGDRLIYPWSCFFSRGLQKEFCSAGET